MNVLRKNRTISYAIHAINSTSPLYLQPFGVVQLTVSAAGADTDIRLDAVPGTLQLELELERCRETSRETINLQCPDASTQQESALEQPTSQSRRRPPIQQLLWRHKTAPKRTHLRRTQPLTFISRRFPHRITVTGANGLAQFVLITRRTRVQTVTRSTTLWREPHGIERITMPLFVTNGLDTLRFLFLHRADADILSRWADGPTEV